MYGSENTEEDSGWDIGVGSTEAKELEPLSHSEPPLPMQRETPFSPVLEEIRFPWTEEPAVPHDNFKAVSLQENSSSPHDPTRRSPYCYS